MDNDLIIYKINFSIMNIHKNELPWVEKYRPKSINKLKNNSKVNPISTLIKYDLGNIKNINNFSIKDIKVN